MKFDIKTCIKVAAVVFVLYLAIYYWGKVAAFIGVFIRAFSSVAIGCAIAYVLNILMSFYERHYFAKYAHKAIIAKSRAPICMVAAIVSLIAIVAIVIMLIVPELVSCTKLLVGQIPPMINKLLEYDIFKQFVPQDVLSSLESINWQNIVTRVVDFVGSGLSIAAGAIYSAVSSVISVIVTGFISIIFSIYFMLSKHTLKSQARRLIHAYFTRSEDKIMHIFEVFDDCFHRFIVGQCLDAVILGTMCVIGMMIFGFPYPQMIGTFIGFTALIPVAGAYIGAIVGAIMIMTVSPLQALLFVVFVIVLQQLEGNFIYPKIVGNSIGLPAVWVLAAITVGGGLMGILGMLIGVPVVAALYRLFDEDLIRRENAERLSGASDLKNKNNKKITG